VIEQLRPYIVTAWHGHRNDANVPEAVRTVWRQKAQDQRRSRRVRRSNVDIALINPQGVVVHAFDGFRPNAPGRETLGQYTSRELLRARPYLGRVNTPSEERPLILPDLEKGARGIRVFVRFLEDRMIAYRAPVVEVVPQQAADWKPLAWPTKERVVQASALKPWLSQIYPPGVMERTNPQTKFVYTIKSTEGELKLRPIKSDGKNRQAILRGVVSLTDEGPNDFNYQGIMEVLLTYKPGETTPHTLRGYFDGIYPRWDPRRRQTRWLSLQAAFESLPE
jgi:hypothetical protein